MVRNLRGVSVVTRLLLSAGIILALIPLIAYWGHLRAASFGWARSGDNRARFDPRPFPLKLRTNFGSDRVALTVPTSRGDLVALNRLFEPAYELKSPSHLLHYLYLWGPEATFDDTRCPSGQQMLALLFDEVRSPAYRPRRPLAYTNSFGQVAIDSSASADAEAHTDQFLSMIGDLGVSLERRLEVGDKHFTLKDALRTSVDNFTTSQELEWTVSAYARYLAPTRQWRNRWGEQYSFDDIVEIILKRGAGVGPCRGTHALQTLCVILQVDEEYSIISPANRTRIRTELARVASLLQRAQHVDGCWSPKWATTARFERYYPEDRAAVFMATGHHLEWMRIAPTDALPPAETIRRALNWCFTNLKGVKVSEVPDDPCPYAHCAKSLVCISWDVPRKGFLPVPVPPEE